MVVFYLVVDVWKVWSGSPLDFVGKQCCSCWLRLQT